MIDFDTFQYPESSTERIAAQGAPGVSAFLGEIPRANLTPWLLSFRPIPGFRSIGQKAADEQRKRLVARLTSKAPGRDRDWQIFRQIWAEWALANLADTPVVDLIKRWRRGDIEAEPDRDLDELLTEAIVATNEKGDVSRELLERFLTFGPFANPETFKAALDHAPLLKDLEKQHFFDSLPQQLADIEAKIKATAEQSARSLETNIARSVDSVAQEAHELTTLVHSLAKQVSSLSELEDSLAQQIQDLRAEFAGLGSRFHALEERLTEETAQAPGQPVSNTDIDLHFDSVELRLKQLEAEPKQPESADSELDELKTQVRLLTSKIGVLEETPVAGAASVPRQPSQEELELQDSIASLRSELSGILLRLAEVEHRPADAHVSDDGTIPKENPPIASSMTLRTLTVAPAPNTAPCTTLDDFATSLEGALSAAGLLLDSSRPVAREIACALALGQQVTFDGTMASLLQGSLLQTIAGCWNVYSVPVGILDDAAMRHWSDGASALQRQLALYGVNRSAYEVFAMPLRDSVVRSQMSLTAPVAVVLCSVIDGPGGLPLIPSYAELGPIIQTDTLQWRGTLERTLHNARAVDLGVIRAAIDGALVPSISEDIQDTLDSIGTPYNTFALRSMQRLGSLLLSLAEKGDAMTAYASLLATRLLPYVSTRGTAKQKVLDALTSGAFAELVSAKRIDQMLSSLR